MKLKSFLLILMLSIVIIPLNINAKTHHMSDNIYSPWIYPLEIIEPGDILDFSDCYSRNIFIDGEKINGCFGRLNECSLQYTANNRMIYSLVFARPEATEVYFNTLSENQEILIYNDSTEDGYYKTGDVIAFYTELGPNDMAFYVYDENDDLIIEYNYTSSRPLTYKLPKINGKDVYWKLESFKTPGNYFSGKCPHFTPFEYTEPKLELKCNKDSIKYGEKANCELCLECVHNISNLNFSLNQKDLKFSNLKYSSNINNIGDNNRIQLSINDENICNEKKTIMTFDVEATKDDTYLDKIALNDIEYVDEIVQAKYEDLDSDLNIISNKPSTNPKTGTELLFIILPFIVLIIIGTIYTLKTKKKTT